MRRLGADIRVPGRLIAVAAAGSLLLQAASALAQSAPAPITPSPPTLTLPPQASVPPAPPPTPGLLGAINRWIDSSDDTFRSHLRGAKRQMDTFGDSAAENTRGLGNKAVEVTKGAVEATKGAVEVTKGAVEVTRDAVDLVAKLPATRVIRGHERCAVAANGAPDCLAAAEALCRKSGYSSGKSMDFTSAEECSVNVLLTGRQAENDCRTVTFISRAVCQ